MNIKNLGDYFNQKNKLSLRNVRTSQEVWHIFVSRLHLILAGISVVVLMFGVTIAVVAYTPILDMIPGYPGNKSRTALIENIKRLDSLEMQVKYWEGYQKTLSMILQGQIRREEVVGVDSVQGRGMKMADPVRRSKSDTMFRMQMTADSVMVLRKETRANAERVFEMMQPVRGQLKETFAPGEGRFGVEISAQPMVAVMSVMDGTVIAEPWSPSTGYVVTVQHSGNMSSTYSNIQQPLVSIGSRVKAGQAIGITPPVKDGQLPVVAFQLWHAGNAVDPENYISF